MKQSNPKIFIWIWVLHMFVYYLVMVLSRRIVANDYEHINNVVFGFVGGFMGWVEQIPMFFIIPALLMLILIWTKLKKQWFIAYSISVTIAYLGNYLWMYVKNTHNKVLFSTDSTDLIFLILPSLLVAIISNWFLFRKAYRNIAA